MVKPLAFAKILILALVFAGGCHDQREPQIADASPTPARHPSLDYPLPAVESAFPAEAPAAVASNGAVLRNKIPDAAPLPAVSALPESVAGLEALYYTSGLSEQKRIEMVEALSLLEPRETVPAMGRIFDREKRLELRLLLLEKLADVTSDETAPARWAVLNRALEPSQHLQVRLSALQTLSESDDPRVPQILRNLSRDKQELIRQQATDFLRDKTQ